MELNKLIKLIGASILLISINPFISNDDNEVSMDIVDGMNCSDFESVTPGGIQSNLTVNHVKILDNWYTRTGSLQYSAGGMDGATDQYLKVIDGASSKASSWVWNIDDYSGDWSASGCFCYDFAIFTNGGSQKPANSLYIFSGTNPFDAPYLAKFVLNNPPLAGDGWDTYCAPVGMGPANGSLPLNTIGNWEMIRPSNGTVSDWNHLIQNIDGIGFPMDIGSGAETYGYDDICISVCASDEVCTTCEPPCNNPVLDISTGYNANTQQVYSTTPGTQDPLWTLEEGPTVNGSINVGSPAFIIDKDPAWTSPSSTSQYISAFQSRTAHSSNLPSTGLAPYTFRREFCVSENNTELVFDLGVHVDNAMKMYLVDDLGGRTLLAELNCETGCNNVFCCPHSNFNGPIEQLSISPQTVSTGIYAIEVEVRNNGVSMGLNIQGTISGAFLESDLCCITTGYITGYKYNDLNCDGKLDDSDQIIPEWEIHLLDDNNNIIKKVTTDINGYYAFEIPEGNYSVVEVLKDDGKPTNSPYGVFSDVKVVNGAVTQINFLNCFDDDYNDPGCDLSNSPDPKDVFNVEMGDIVVQESCHGIILTSPNGRCYRITVNDDGTLNSTEVECLNLSSAGAE